MTVINQNTETKGWPVLATIITLLAVVIMFALGVWQLERAEQKTQRLAQIKQRQMQNTVELADINQMQGDNRDITFFATGNLTASRYFLLDNRIHNGQVGYEVIVPIETDFGILLINFGWIAAGPFRDTLPDVKLASGLVQLTGMLAIPELNPMISETAVPGQTWPVLIQQLDLEVVSGFLEQPVIRFVMLLEKEQQSAFQRNWQPVVMPPEKHVAYAVQWFGLGLACLIIFIIALKARFKRKHD